MLVLLKLHPVHKAVGTFDSTWLVDVFESHLDVIFNVK